MLDSKFHSGYTLYLSCDQKKNIIGGYLKRIRDGLVSDSLSGSEELLINSFSNVVSSLESGNTLQMYADGFSIVSMLGRKTFDGPYGENECLENILLVNNSGFLSCLIELDSILERSKEKPIVYKKAYRLYGNDKYLLEENL